MARLYANENFPFPVVEELRRLGHDVLTVLETGKSGQAWPDHAVLGFATQESRAVLTLNRKHFIRLHHLSPDHAGTVICTFNIDFLGQAKQIVDEIDAYPELRGHLIRVNRPSPI